MDPKRKSLWELNVAVLLWAGTALFAKWIPLPPFQITGLRSVVAAGILLLLLLGRRQSLRVDSRRDLAVLVCSGLAMAGHWVTYFQSIQISTVAVGILSLHAYPVMTALLEPLWFREKLHGADLALAGVVGLGLVVLVPEFSFDSRILQGTLWGLLSAILFTVRNLLTRQVAKTYGGTKVTFYQLATTAVALLPLALAAGQPVALPSALKLILLGVLFTALPHTLFTNALQHLSARSTSMIATLLPVYGAISAALLLGEIPALRTVLGGAIILAAVTLETWRTLQRR